MIACVQNADNKIIIERTFEIEDATNLTENEKVIKSCVKFIQFFYFRFLLSTPCKCKTYRT